MNLWVCVEVATALNVDNNQLVPGTFEGEVAEGLWGLPTCLVVHEA